MLATISVGQQSEGREELSFWPSLLKRWNEALLVSPGKNEM